MTTKILPSFLIALCFFSANCLTAQNNTGFAVTGATKGNIAWTVIRQIDLSTGKEIRTIYSPENNTAIVDAASGSRLKQLDLSAPVSDEMTTVANTGILNTVVTYANGAKSDVVTAPTETLVAASAYDARNNRLFFTPMHSNELRYFDLNAGTNTVFYVRNVALRTFPESNDEATVITRMCFGSNGYGYALTNDANHLIRFSSGNKITITDLGSVQDEDKGENVSIRNMINSWGGDMIADAFGNLYVISMKGNVFKINLQTMAAHHVAQIKNLPVDYTVNGAAVDAAGNILVSSATRTEHYYSVDMVTWLATPLAKQQEQVYNASDLASGYFAYESVAAGQDASVRMNNDKLSVYPNPVVSKSINLVFDRTMTENHSVQLMDPQGHVVFTKVLNVNGKSSTQLLLPPSLSSGMYIIKVINKEGGEAYSAKILVN